MCNVGHEDEIKPQRLDGESGFVARYPEMHMSGTTAMSLLMVVEF